MTYNWMTTDRDSDHDVCDCMCVCVACVCVGGGLVEDTIHQYKLQRLITLVCETKKGFQITFI